MSHWNRSTASALCAAAVAVIAAPSTASEAERQHPLRTGDEAVRLAEASRLRTQDVRSLGAALTSLGETKAATAADIAFLTEFIAREPSRALRLIATEAAHRIGPAAVADALVSRAAIEDDPVRAAACVDAAGLLARRDHAAAFTDLLRHRSGLVASAAADALARIATKADAAVIADKGLSHTWPVVAERCGWTLLDVLGDRTKALSAFLPKSGDVPLERAARIASVASLLSDPKSEPHKWTPPFAAARKALAGAPREVPFRALNPEMERWMRDGLGWLRDKAPADHWLVCASLKSVSYTSDGLTHLDAEAGRLDLSFDDAGLPPARFANLVHRNASILWRKRLGEPWTGQRAWFAVIADSYDLCAAGSVDGAGEKNVTREKFVERALERRPWEDR